MDTLGTTLHETKRAASLRPLVFFGALVACFACTKAPPPAPAPVATTPPPAADTVRTPPPAPPARLNLVLLGTTDVHNRIYPYDYYTRSAINYGLARLKPVVDGVRRNNP